MRRPTKWTLAVAGLSLMVGAVPAAPARAADAPIATPAAPTTPADNEVNRAKRDTDRANNDADRAAGGGNALADRQADDASRDAKSAVSSIGASARPPAVFADADGVRHALAELVGTAVMPDHLDRLTQRLMAADRERMRGSPGYAQNYGAALNDTARNFGVAWRAKYGHPFNVDGAAAAITDGFATVGQGAPIGPDRPSVAQVTIAASHGLPLVNLPLTKELPDGWKADVPDSLDVDTLRRNLTDELTAAVAMKDRWPADEAEAYRAVTHRILLALANQPIPPAE